MPLSTLPVGPFRYWKAAIRWPRSLLQAEQPQLSQPFLIGEVLQPSDHVCGPPLHPLQNIHVLPMLGAPELGTVLRWGFTRVEHHSLLQLKKKPQNKTMLCADKSEQDFVVNIINKRASLNVRNIKKIHVTFWSVCFTPENWNVQSWMLFFWCLFLFFFFFWFFFGFFCLSLVSKLTSLGQLEMTWRSRVHFHPLLVRVLHKSRLRYYGKPEKKMDMPYQVKRDKHIG